MKIIKKIKTQIKAGAANPSPPLGPALGQAKINIMDFCTKFNEMTKKYNSVPLNVDILVIEGAAKKVEFSIIIKGVVTTFLIKEAFGIKSGANTPGLKNIKKVTKEQFMEVVKKKANELNCMEKDPDFLEKSYLIMAGSARSMGIEITE